VCQWSRGQCLAAAAAAAAALIASAAANIVFTDARHYSV